MIFNHKRVPVWDWDGEEEALCPECESPLIAKRGEIVCWHWAHKPRSRKGDPCPHEESAWHLTMKSVYLNFADWEVEAPIEANGKKFRCDAMNRKTGRIREFVHSLSDHYMMKHYCLHLEGFDVAWIIDGEKFCSARLRFVSGGGIKRLLKPTAKGLHDSLAYGCKVTEDTDTLERVGGGLLVHFADAIWKEWKNDVWFTVGGRAATIADMYRKEKRASGHRERTCSHET